MTTLMLRFDTPGRKQCQSKMPDSSSCWPDERILLLIFYEMQRVPSDEEHCVLHHGMR